MLPKFSGDTSEDGIHLRLYNDKLANKFEIRRGHVTRDVIWFHAEVPIQQWNSICIVRNFQQQRFRIYQNNKLVYDYGECVTNEVRDSKIFSNQVGNRPCYEGNDWSLTRKKPQFVGPCTKEGFTGT